MPDAPQPSIDRLVVLDGIIETLDQLHAIAEEEDWRDLAYLLALARREARQRRRVIGRH